MARALADQPVAHKLIYPNSCAVAAIIIWTAKNGVNKIVISSHDPKHTPSPIFSMVLASDDITEKFIQLKLNLVLLAYGRLYGSFILLPANPNYMDSFLYLRMAEGIDRAPNVF